MTEHVAASLQVLLGQINRRWPERDKASDGAKGDKAHANRPSDHNPNAQGTICARDFTHDPENGPRGRFLANALIASRDERIKYIISDGEICSGLGGKHPAWKWRPYTGVNAHKKHMHISVRSTPALAESKRDWDLDAYGPLDDVVGSTIWLQKKLNKHGYKLKEDGDYGPATQKATRAFAIDTLAKASK